jgi:hypothetical protein
MAAVSTRSLRLGNGRLPVVLPNRRDPRLHTAAVIISVHVIGITALGFRVSVPQILSAIVAAGLVDVTFTLRHTGKLVWPASGMLTGSGVALILRLTGMSGGDYWSWAGWYLFALIAGISVLTKYVIRFGGNHLFNPSNVGLVAAFLVLGSTVVEPLDFWWAPMGFWMALAYLIILGGGVLITKRLNLLEMAITFWVVLAGGLAVLSTSGHCMTATWSVEPVCGASFWSVLVTSPEILIFMLFMITDPKTVPRGRLARVAFAGSLAIATTLLMAPHSIEFGAKVALLGSLVIWSPLSPLFDRTLADRQPGRSGVLELADRVLTPRPERRSIRTFAGGAAVGSVAVLLTVAVIAAGVPARTSVVTQTAPAGVQALDIDVDPASLPPIDIDPRATLLGVEIGPEFAAEVALMLAENLAVEAEAMRTADGGLLAMADGGERLDEIQGRLDAAIASGERTVASYEFDTLALAVGERTGEQGSAALELTGTGTLEEVTLDAFGSQLERTVSSFSNRFVMRRLGSERWLLVEVLPD